MIEWIISSSVLIVIVIAIRTVAKGRISLRLQYAIWGLVLLRLLIPFSVGSADISVANLTTQTHQSVADTPVQQGTDRVHTPQAQPNEMPQVDPGVVLPQQSTHTTPAEAETVSVGFVLCVLWVIGSAAMAGLFLFANIRLRSRILRSRRSLDLRKKNLAVYATGAIDTPCLFGTLFPAIYVTPSVAEEPTVLRHALEHEATHHRHGDHIWAILRCVCLAVHWYNPLVWCAAFLSQRDAELACDEATIKRLGEEERAEYGRTLIGMTCKKKPNVLLTTTTMTAGKSAIKERIRLIAKKPKMAVYTLVAVLLVAMVAVGCTFTGPEGDAPDTEQTQPLGTEPADTQPQNTQPSATEPKITEDPEPGKLYEKPFDDLVCIAVQPTGVCSSGGVYRYLVPQQQDVLQEYYAHARASAHKYTQRDSGQKHTGWWIVYQGQWWQAAEDGTLYGTDPYDSTYVCVDSQNAQMLYAICDATVEHAGMGEPVRPEEIVGIKKATLQWNGIHTITDAAALEKIETMLHNSTQLDGAACWFTAQLVLELENGDSKIIAMATDSCSSWMSEGVAYDYGKPDDNSNQEFYAIFAPMVIHQKSQEGIEAVRYLLDYMDWSKYAAQYGNEEAFALMEKIGNWATEDPANRFRMSMYWAVGLEGACADRYAALLDRLYAHNPIELAWACLDSNEPQRDNALALLADYWNMSAADVRAKLQGDIPQN